MKGIDQLHQHIFTHVEELGAIWCNSIFMQKRILSAIPLSGLILTNTALTHGTHSLLTQNTDSDVLICHVLVRLLNLDLALQSGTG